MALLQVVADKGAKERQSHKGHAGQARHQSQENQHAAEDEKDALIAEHLVHQVAAQVSFGSGAGDDKARSRGNQESRYLAHQALTDGQQSICLECLSGIQPPLQHANDKTTGNIDEHDDDSGDGIALDELGSTVHGTEEIRFPLDLLAAYLGLSISNSSLIQVCIDGHLLAGHSIQGEAGRNLSHALRALGDDDEVDDHQDDEDDETNHCITTDNEVAESCDDFSCIAIQKDETGRRNVQRQAEQSGYKEQRWKNR